MIRRRSTISIHDYPEHLNPFREERRQSIGNKFRSFGQRGSSFRNAWNLLLPSHKRSQSFSRAGSPERAHDTWTVRRAPKTGQEAFGLPSSWAISPRRRYTPPSSQAGSPPRSPDRRGSQISVATLGTDSPSPEDGLHWQGARPKKRRAPLPPTSPTGSSATSSHAGSTSSLRDGRRPDDSKDAERESLQVLVSRIQQEFSEEPGTSRRHQEDGGQGRTRGYRPGKTSVQVDKAFVVERRVSPAPTRDDAVEDNHTVEPESQNSEKTVHHGVAVTDVKQEDSGPDGDCSTPPTKDDDTANHEKQITANVFVETTSRTISNDDGKATRESSDDAETSKTIEPVSGMETPEQTLDEAKPQENQAGANSLDHNANKKDDNAGKPGVDSSVSREEGRVSPSEVSASECQVETVTGRYECGAFVVSTPDTASVYEDAASEVDSEDPDVKSVLNDRHKPNLDEAHAPDSDNTTVHSDVKISRTEVPEQPKNIDMHTNTSVKTFSDDAIPSETSPIGNLDSKTNADVVPRDVNPEIVTRSSIVDSRREKFDAFRKPVSSHKPQNNSFKFKPTVSVTSSRYSSFKASLNNSKGNTGETSGSESPTIPSKDIRARANGDVLRTPVTAPRSKPTNGLPGQTSSTSPSGSSTPSPTPPPRNKPQPVPRMKKLKKLFSSQ